MQEAINTIQLLMDSANAGHGRELTPLQVEHVARYIMTYERAADDLYTRVMELDSLIAAYVNEYGDELLKEFVEVEDGIIVEAEVEPAGEDERLDASQEGEEE